MKKVYSSVLFIFFFSAGLHAQTTDFDPVTKKLLSKQDAINIEFLREHLAVLAADSMEGRETGEPGQKKAAEYLVEQYRKMGLKPAGTNDSYYQNFDLIAHQKDSTVYELYKNGDLHDRSVASRNSSAKFMRAFGGADTLSGKIVFAGFGVNDTSRKVTHLEGVDLSGKWVMVFRDIPHVAYGDTLIDPSFNNNTRFGEIINRRQAEGILLIPTETDSLFESDAHLMRSNYENPGSMTLKYLDNLSGGFPQGYNLIKPELAAQVLGLKGNSSEALLKLRMSIIEDITAFKPRETEFSLKHTPYSSRVNTETENIAGIIEGSDPDLKDEIVVLTSHYDHVGIGVPDSTGDAIYNGADDDGSGTVALMNIAKTLIDAKRTGASPRRSVLILHVSGEEKGLLGSQYYSDHPLYPMDKTIANVNVDMIGRVDGKYKKEGIENYSYVIGNEIISTGLDSLVDLANSATGDIVLDDRYNSLQDPNQFYRRSDHWHFGRFGVPFVFFFSGVHEDYHRPSDEIHKIRFEKLKKTAQTIYGTTVLLANTDNPPEVDNQEFINITKTLPR